MVVPVKPHRFYYSFLLSCLVYRGTQPHHPTPKFVTAFSIVVCLVFYFLISICLLLIYPQTLLCAFENNLDGYQFHSFSWEFPLDLALIHLMDQPSSWIGPLYELSHPIGRSSLWAGPPYGQVLPMSWPCLRTGPPYELAYPRTGPVYELALSMDWPPYGLALSMGWPSL